MILIDVVPLSLGIEMQNGNMSVLIPRNTSIPTSMTKQYTNSHDNQETIGIKIYQGDKSTKVADCQKISEFDLGGFGGCKKGQALVEVTFEVDTNGILNITAMDKRQGTAKNITVADACKFTDYQNFRCDQIVRFNVTTRHFVATDRL